MPVRKSTVHTINIWKEEYEPLSLGLKTFTVRTADRDYQPGDLIVGRWYDSATNSHSRNIRDVDDRFPPMAEEYLEYPNLNFTIGYVQPIGDGLVVLALIPFKGRQQ